MSLRDTIPSSGSSRGTGSSHLPPTDGPSHSQLSSLGFYRGKETLGLQQAFGCFPPKPAHQHSQRSTRFISPFPSSAAVLRFSSATSLSARATPHPPPAPAFPRAVPISTCWVTDRVSGCPSLPGTAGECGGCLRSRPSQILESPAEPHPEAKQQELGGARPFAQELPGAWTS